ncbi:MAG: hypothetical protein ACREC9_13845 [Methylocella sp.]
MPSIVSITFLVGLAMIVVALLGGGIKVKEIEIPKLAVFPRILSFVTGCALLALLFLRPDLFQVFSDKVSPPNPPPSPSPVSPTSPNTPKLPEISEPPPEGPATTGCKSGYVWREAQFGDGVCVTPEDRAEARAQNTNAPNNRVVGGGNYRPNTCRVGYVWREAFGGDVVCVTPYEREKAQKQNAENPQHSLP